MIQIVRVSIIVLIACLFCRTPIGADDEQAFQKEAETALRSALNFIAGLQRGGGWAMAWTEDLKYFYGEHRIREHNIITVQPPATPGLGQTFLKASQILKDEKYRQVALAAAQALIEGQLENGGWPHEYYPGDKKGTGTFDDDVTQGATRFLLSMYRETQDATIEAAVKRAAQFMLDSQYENGGWPQRYPGGNGYGKNITLNDQAMMDVMRTLLVCYHEFGDERYRNAALRGADCLVALRGAPPQAGWAQQFTPDGKPDSARAFEPVGLSSAESMDAVRVLKEIYIETGDKKYLEACLPVFDWLKRSKLENGKWARLYEYGSNRAIYSTADGKVIYDVNQARPGYGWQGSYFSESLQAEIQRLIAAPTDQRHEEKNQQKPRSLRSARERAQEAIKTLDGKGRWLSSLGGSMRNFYLESEENPDPQMKCIHSVIYERNIGVLLDYLEAAHSRIE
ncbi:MAG: pectate lyase [Candidatus Hinthialibacter antarcticus]|nr:pectate lyase [Candidatus Hinthialibacter antarcticus]